MDKERGRADVLVRLRKIEGQVRGISRMIEEERACDDVVMQLTAVRSALDQVLVQVLVAHAMQCVQSLPPEEARSILASALLRLTRVTPVSSSVD